MRRALVALIALLLPSVAAANEAILAALKEDAGWTLHAAKAKNDVDVYKKSIPGQDIPAFKGVKVMEVDPDHLFDAIIDFRHHVGLSKDIPLTRSVVIKESGNTIDFWQYLNVPGWTLANDRFWFAKARISRNVGGEAGHHIQTWEIIDAEQYPDHLAKAKAIDEDSVMTPLNYGLWEVKPVGDGKVELIYRVISDPGGSLPKSAQSLATSRTLPDNLLQFEAEAKRRMAK